MKTSPKRSYSVIENERSGLVFAKTRSIILGKGRGYGFLSGFPPFSFTETVRGCMSLKKYKSQGKAVEVTVNSREENS